MNTMNEIILSLKERKANNKTVKYIDGQYDLSKLLEDLNVTKDECCVLYITNIVSKYIKSTYNIKTQSIMKMILNNKECLIDNDLKINNKIFIVEDCNLLDINIFNKLLSILSMKCNIVLVGDKYMLPTVDNNTFDLTLNVVAQKYLEKIELQKNKKEIEMSSVLKPIERNLDSSNCEDIGCITSVHFYKKELDSPLDNLIKISDNVYTGFIDWQDLKKLMKSNSTYITLDKYLNSNKFNTTNMPYLTRFIENPDNYFQKTIIMSDKLELKDAFLNGVITSNFLNIYYYIKIEDLKNKFIEMEYPSFKEVLNLDLPKLDKKIMTLIEKEFREKYGSWESYFTNSFFSMSSLSVDILLNQDRDYIFKYTLANPDTNNFINNENIIRLAVLKCYNMMNLKQLNKTVSDNLPFSIDKFNENIDEEKLLAKYNEYDNKLEVIHNIPYSIYNIVNWKALSDEKSKYKLDKLLPSDLNLSISNIQSIINFKFDIIDAVTKKYGAQGLNLIFKGRDESFLFNPLFKAMNKNSYEKDRPIQYNLTKICANDFLKIKIKFISASDMLYLDEFLRIKKGFKSGIYDKSTRLLEYGFIDLLNDKNIDWQEIVDRNM